MVDLVTLAQANRWLGIPVAAQPDSDALVSSLISAASAELQSYISRTITATNYVETRNGLGGWAMVLMNTPIISVSSLSINGLVIPARAALGPSPTYPTGGYNFDRSRVMLTGYDFCRGVQNVMIGYRGGYETVPMDVQQATLDVVGDWYKYADRIGKASEGIQGQNTAFITAQAIPTRALGIMKKYDSVAPVY